MAQRSPLNSMAIPVRAGTLVVLCGVSGSGKSSFATRNFLPTEVVSSDECRAMLCDDPTNQFVSGSAFKLMQWIVGERLRFRRTTVVDSTALDRRFRRDMLKLAQEHKARTLIIFFDTDKESSIERDSQRPHPVGPEIIERQYPKFLKSLEDVGGEAWDRTVIITPETVSDATISRQSGSFDLRHLNGPFDVIGDVHGCLDELMELLGLLGYSLDEQGDMSHPEGRTLVFLGDLADRGPHNMAVFDMVMQLVSSGVAIYTPGNHCNKLMRYLRGGKVSKDWGLASTVEGVESRERDEPGYSDRLRQFIEAAPTYAWLDGGALVVAHGGIKEAMIGRDNSRVRAMVLYGDTTGESNPDGTPIRLDWAQDYEGSAAIVYGHTPVSGPVWRNNTINIDQGCVFGGWLSALRWPERAIAQVRARRAYYAERTPAFIADEG